MGLAGGLSRAPHARIWRGVRGPSIPQKKIEFGIGGDAISRYIEGLICTFQFVLSQAPVTFSLC